MRRFSALLLIIAINPLFALATEIRQFNVHADGGVLSGTLSVNIVSGLVIDSDLIFSSNLGDQFNYFKWGNDVEVYDDPEPLNNAHFTGPGSQSQGSLTVGDFFGGVSFDAIRWTATNNAHGLALELALTIPGNLVGYEGGSLAGTSSSLFLDIPNLNDYPNQLSRVNAYYYSDLNPYNPWDEGIDYFINGQLVPVPVPEPSTGEFMVFGLLGLLTARWSAKLLRPTRLYG